MHGVYLLFEMRTPPGYHFGSPVVDFMVVIVHVNCTACQVVLDAGFPHILIYMYWYCHISSSMYMPTARSTDEAVDTPQLRIVLGLTVWHLK